MSFCCLQLFFESMLQPPSEHNRSPSLPKQKHVKQLHKQKADGQSFTLTKSTLC